VSELPPPSPDADPALLRRAQAGDEEAFGRLMRANYEAVFRLVHAIVRNEHDARDVSQEVWLTVWKQIGGFRGDAKFTTWLHPIAVRRSIDHLRKRRRWYDRFLPFASGDDTVESAPEPFTSDDARSEAEHGERTVHLQKLLDSLPPKLRAVLALREVQGLSYEEIARATGIPAGTVMSRLYHARRLLAQKLKEQP
jgi:RNA polymerase sigma-70 factor (ECF subfamily)